MTTQCLDTHRVERKIFTTVPNIQRKTSTDSAIKIFEPVVSDGSQFAKHAF